MGNRRARFGLDPTYRQDCCCSSLALHRERSARNLKGSSRADLPPKNRKSTRTYDQMPPAVQSVTVIHWHCFVTGLRALRALQGKSLRCLQHGLGGGAAAAASERYWLQYIHDSPRRARNRSPPRSVWLPSVGTALVTAAGAPSGAGCLGSGRAVPGRLGGYTF